MTIPASWYGYIAAGLGVLGLIVALMVTRHTLADVKHQRDLLKVQLQTSNNSITALEHQVNQDLKDEQDMANADQVRVKASQDALHAAEAAAKGRQDQINRLLASAARPQPKGVCEPSDTVKSIWQ